MNQTNGDPVRCCIMLKKKIDCPVFMLDFRSTLSFPVYYGITNVGHCRLCEFMTEIPGRCSCNIQLVIFKHTSRIDIFSISCEIALRWMPQDLDDNRSISVQVMAWCHQATSHYLSQCWPRYLSPYDTMRSQWVNAHDNVIYDQQFLLMGWPEAEVIMAQLSVIQGSELTCSYHYCDWILKWHSWERI